MVIALEGEKMIETRLLFSIEKVENGEISMKFEMPDPAGNLIVRIPKDQLDLLISEAETGRSTKVIAAESMRGLNGRIYYQTLRDK